MRIPCLKLSMTSLRSKEGVQMLSMAGKALCDLDPASLTDKIFLTGIHTFQVSSLHSSILLLALLEHSAPRLQGAAFLQELTAL